MHLMEARYAHLAVRAESPEKLIESLAWLKNCVSWINVNLNVYAFHLPPFPFPVILKNLSLLESNTIVKFHESVIKLL